MCVCVDENKNEKSERGEKKWLWVAIEISYDMNICGDEKKKSPYKWCAYRQTTDTIVAAYT